MRPEDSHVEFPAEHRGPGQDLPGLRRQAGKPPADDLPDPLGGLEPVERTGVDAPPARLPAGPRPSPGGGARPPPGRTGCPRSRATWPAPAVPRIRRASARPAPRGAHAPPGATGLPRTRCSKPRSRRSSPSASVRGCRGSPRVAVGADHQQAAVGEAPGQVEQPQRRRVGPVEVVEDERRAGGRRRRAQEGRELSMRWKRAVSAGRLSHAGRSGRAGGPSERGWPRPRRRRRALSEGRRRALGHIGADRLDEGQEGRRASVS